MEAQFPVLCSSKPLKPGSEKFQSIPITTDVFKLGRGNHNTVVIPYKSLSKDHCILKKVEEEWFLENCSYSSIKINGNKLCKGQKRKLYDQDIIKLDSANELVYTFVSKLKNSTLRKRQRLDDENTRNDNIVKKKSESPKKQSNDKIENLKDTQTMRLKEEIMSEQSVKEKEIYDDYAVRIEKLKGNKKTVKRQKALLKMQRDTRLELLRVKTEEKMTILMAQQNTESLHGTKQSKDQSSKQCEQTDQKKSSREDLDQSRARREQDRVRVKERRELKKLRRETRQLKLDKERKLKELEKQKLRREKELEDELSKVNKKLAKEIELREKEKRRVEQLLKQKEDLKKVSPSSGSDKLDMESELLCSICSELFVRATTLGCSHSFCQYCIRRWTANKKECPICRAPIASQCRSIVLDSLVEKMAESEDAKKKRQELVKTRDALEAKEPTAAVINRETRRRYDIDDLDHISSDSSYHGRESSLEPDFDMLVPMDPNTDDSNSDFDGSAVYHHSSPEYEYEDDPEEEIQGYELGERPLSSDDDYAEYENREDNEENYEEGMEHYEEGENSAEEAENYEQDENYGEPESYGEPENLPSENEPGDSSAEDSAPENYDEGEISAPENEHSDEHSLPENEEFEGENEDFEGENSAPENEDFEAENSAPENEYFEENSAPENEDFEENSGPENEDFEENSAPEYDGDSYPDDGNDVDDYDDDYY